jgi:UPF0042 nucleotide-binding protein
MHPITVYSFGYLHPMPADVPLFDITVDLRRLLADPAHRPEGDMLDMTGMDDAVREFVFATPGSRGVLFAAMRMVRDAARYKPVSVAFGCAGGRHRSVVLASELYLLLPEATDLKVRHLHVHLPRVIRHQEAQ